MLKIDNKAIIPWLISIGIFLLVVLVWAILGKEGIERIENYLERERQAKVVAHQGSLSGSAIRVKPAVVSICTVEASLSASQGASPLKGIGSGVVVSPMGYIVTSFPNVEDAGDIKVVNFEQTHFEGTVLEQGHHHIYDASVVSVFPAAGLAILKVEGDPMPFSRFGDSNSVRIGDWCLAMGNPFAQKTSATSGIISSLNQTKNLGGIVYRNLIETTCKGGNGFTGGPLVNRWGEVVGIVINKGYAIPSNQVLIILSSIGIQVQ